ncbi:hypothetical protein OESDEN_13339 [Oesophagostomum dentatum]|uniref:Endonuclease/exonuclease/phosphatase family protein n=1 Tax=Oesophagostomum dentatum TaxID=61180 RepID=A0A0B1STN3_OESDE|nr:hypothetical protein OESDEN_13339 [Oesophagostomum dentatum]
MLSKLFGFLNELFTRSRTQQWERVLGRQLQIVDSVERRAPSKRSTRTFPYSPSRLQRTPLPMLVPQNSILLWKEPVDPADSEKPATLSLLFDFSHNGSPLLVALRRPVTEPFAETAKRIEAKIRKLASPQKSRKSLPAPVAEQSNGDMLVSVEAPDLPTAESLTLEDVMTSQQGLIIGGHSYSIIRDPPDIASLTCALKPVAGCPIYPAIDFRQGSVDKLPSIHWYIYTRQLEESSNGRSKENGTKETIRILDGSPRKFAVSNCEYRWTGSSYVPSSVDVGKRLLVVADLGPHAIVKCGVSKFAVETIDEPLLCEENVQWCQEERPSNCLRVVSYNILADLYLDLSGPQESLYFPYCPKAYQMYEYRYPLILKELLSYDMDLCFLQEVDHRMQMRYLSALFQSIDLEMCFSKKEKEVTEGSVIAYRRQRFELVSSECHGIASLLENSGSDVNRILNSSTESLEIFTSRPTTIQVI